MDSKFESDYEQAHKWMAEAEEMLFVMPNLSNPLIKFSFSHDYNQRYFGALDIISIDTFRFELIQWDFRKDLVRISDPLEKVKCFGVFKPTIRTYSKELCKQEIKSLDTLSESIYWESMHKSSHLISTGFPIKMEVFVNRKSRFVNDCSQFPKWKNVQLTLDRIKTLIAEML